MTNPLRPASVPLRSAEQVFHKYTVEVLDVKSQQPCKIYNAVVVKDVCNEVPFPLGSTPDNNGNLRITPSPVYDSRPPKTHVQGVFFVVNVYNAKTDQQKNPNKIELANYNEMTSGGMKNGTRDNRKWTRCGDLERHDRDIKLSLKDQMVQVYPASAIPTEAERAFAVGFKHETINLGHMPDIIHGMTTGSDFQTAVSHYSGQIVERQLRNVSIKPSVVLGNRVFFENGPSDHGLQQMHGYHGKISYDSEGNPNILREPCSAYFYQNITVAEFMDQFFGSTATSSTDKATLDRMSAALKGAEVVVATSQGDLNKTRSISGVGHSTERDAVWLRAFGVPSSSFRSPKMPLVNIGSVNQPLYHPAELCKIVGTDQLFKGQVPLTISDEHFKMSSDDLDDHSPLNGDPYPKAQSNGFTVLFVNMTSDVAGKATTAVNSEIMDSLKEHVGKRYNNTLENSLSGLVSLKSTQATLKKDVANVLVPGIRSVVIVVVPHSLSVSEKDSIRTSFDTDLGVQCHIADSRDVLRRFHPVHDIGLKKITGGIVQQIFARAKVTKGCQIPSTVAPVEAASQIIGMHVHELKQEHNYLVDVISVTNQGVQHARVFSRVFHADSHEALAAELSSCVEDNLTGEPQSLKVYLRGVKDDINAHVMVNMGARLQTWFLEDEITSLEGSFSLTSLFSGPNILMTNKDQFTLQPATLQPGTQQMSISEVSNGEVEAEAITAKNYNVLPNHNTANLTHKPFRMNCLKSTIGRVDQGLGIKSSACTVLSTHHIPTILHLAGEASKRTQLRIRQKDAATLQIERDQLAVAQSATQLFAGASPAVCEYTIKPLHRKLRNTFYFL